MQTFDFEMLPLKDAFFIHNFSTGDNRGGFTKCFEKSIFSSAGIQFQLSESFVSVSSKDVIRGLHFQLKPQAKIVSVVCGCVYDVIVDLRPDSPTFKQWGGFELSEENHCALYVPKGFAHGFLSKEDHTIMLYQCDGAYDKETDSGIRFDDPDIGVEWPVEDIEKTIHSERDLHLMSFKEYLQNPMRIID